MLIISVQKFKKFTQNIVNQIESCGFKNILAIRTDQNIKTKYKIIGLKKNNNKFYITTKIKDIDKVSDWADYVAVDCRHENKNLIKILNHCIDNNLKIVADIYSKEDIDNLIDYKKCIFYIATTFNFNETIKNKCKIIQHAKSNGFKVIAEGGYKTIKEMFLATKAGADHICIGSAIFNYIDNIKNFNKFYE